MEVMRISGDIVERIAGGDDAVDTSFDKESHENRLTCMVSPVSCRSRGNGAHFNDYGYLDDKLFVIFLILKIAVSES